MGRMIGINGSLVDSLYIFICVCILFSTANAAATKKWRLYHSWDGGKEFIERSDLILSIDDTGSNVDLKITHRNDSETKDSSDEKKALLDPQFVKNWVEQNYNSLYHVKLVEIKDDGSEDDDGALFSSVPACELLRANFREEIVLRLGNHASAISFSYIPLVSPLAPKTCITADIMAKNNNQASDSGNDDLVAQWENKKLSNRWDTQRLSYETHAPGMTVRPIYPPQKKAPPGITFLPRLNAQGKLVNALPGEENKSPEEQMKEEGAQQGFMRKYWYIILPLMVANLWGGAPEEGEQQQGQAQPGGGPAPQQPQAAGAGAGAGKQRRGKRG